MIRLPGSGITGLYNALTSGELLVAVLAGIGVALGMIALIAGKYQLRTSAYHYDLQEHSSFHADVDQERYIRSTVVHRAKPQHTGHPGGGGGGGSGVHTSSGGGVHGGGSGRGF